MLSAPSTSTVTNSNKSGTSKPVKDVNKKVHSVNKNVTLGLEKVTNENTTSDATTKHQPTAEQMRIANLMNDKTDFTELEAKVSQITELTGASRDKAVVALHDCDGKLDKAIDMILEGDTVNESEWISSSKKKKSKQTPGTVSGDTDDIGINTKSTINGDKPRGGVGSGQRGRGAPRLQRGNRSGTKFIKDERVHHNNNVVNAADDENQENTPSNSNATGFHSGMRKKYDENRRGRGRGGGPKSTRGGDRGRGTRTFQNRGYRSNNIGGTTVNNDNNDSFPNSIDTWTNSTADTNTSKPVVNSDCTTMTVGNWSDIAANEDWSEEDWESNLMETKVFTPSAKTLQEKDELNELGNSNVSAGSANQNVGIVSSLPYKSAPESVNTQQQQQQSTMNSIISNSVTRNANSTSTGAALLQQLQQQATSQAPSQANHYGMSYSKQATESIKSLVGIPSSSAYNSSNSANLLTSSDLDNQTTIGHVRNQTTVSHNEPPGVTKQPQQQQQQASRLPPQKRPTKIPESAVEMPSNDSISSLNVQFGALDFGSDTFALSNDAATFHEAVNHAVNVKSKPLSSSSSTTASNLSSSLLPESTYRANTATVENTMSKPSTVASTTADLTLTNTVLGNQSDTVLDRKSSSTYGQKQIDTQQHNKPTLYPTSVSQIHPQTTSTSDISGYKNVTYSQPDATNMYGSNYGNAYVYPQTTNQMGYSNVGYSSYSTGTSSGVSQKSGTMKDVDTSGAQKHAYTDLQNVQGSALGLVSNSTVTTNVLKNSVPATGKGIPNVPPGCTPVLGTQYIMGQAGLPAFYPLYDVQIPTARDHNFSYTQGNNDVKYSRPDDGSSVVSTQSQQMSQQTHPGHIFGQLPPGYGFFYTPGVNMVPQNLYGAAAPLFPVSPAANTHAGSAGSAFPKGNPAYGSHSYASAGYDSLNSVPQSDYVKQSYASSGSQQVKGMNTGTSGDLTTNQLYGKSHAQLTKGYDKASFQTGTPPPFQAGQLASFGATPSQFIQMLPQTQTSMLHHSLQGDGSQGGTSGVGVSRPISQSQKGSGPNSTKYYNNWT